MQRTQSLSQLTGWDSSDRYGGLQSKELLWCKQCLSSRQWFGAVHRPSNLPRAEKGNVMAAMVGKLAPSGNGVNKGSMPDVHHIAP